MKMVNWIRVLAGAVVLAACACGAHGYDRSIRAEDEDAIRRLLTDGCAAIVVHIRDARPYSELGRRYACSVDEAIRPIFRERFTFIPTAWVSPSRKWAHLKIGQKYIVLGSLERPPIGPLVRFARRLDESRESRSILRAVRRIAKETKPTTKRSLAEVAYAVTAHGDFYDNMGIKIDDHDSGKFLGRWGLTKARCQAAETSGHAICIVSFSAVERTFFSRTMDCRMQVIRRLNQRRWDPSKLVVQFRAGDAIESLFQRGRLCIAIVAPGETKGSQSRCSLIAIAPIKREAGPLVGIVEDWMSQK